MLIRLARWYGGKLRLVNHILALLPNYVNSWHEVCCGSAAVTLNKCKHELEVINDLDDELINLFNVLVDRKLGANLLDRLFELRYCEQNFLLAKRAQQNHFRGIDNITMAVMTYALITMSFNSCRTSFRRGMSQFDYNHSIRMHMPSVYERLADVRVTQYDATYLLGKISNNKTAFALADLPYRHDLRAAGACNVYGKEMSMKEHIRFLETARDAKCAIMICGYRNEDGTDIYDRYLLPTGKWRHYLLAEIPKSCKTTKSKGLGREWIWTNYPLPDHAKYFLNLDSANWK